MTDAIQGTPRTDAIVKKHPRQIDLREWTYDETVDADFARTLERECNALRAEVERLTAELRIKSEFLSSRQCPDHSGKWERGRCLQCEVERLAKEIKRLTLP